MDDDDHNMYGLHSSVDYTDKALMMSPENLMLPQDYNNLLSSTGFRERMLPMFGSDELISAAPEFQRVNGVDHHYHHHGAGGSGYPAAQEDDMFSVIKTKIASHPSYPRLLEAYIDIQKVGAPPEIASLLDEIVRGNNICKRDAVTATYIGADPELDEFMRTYCDMLVKYKSDLARPFDEATTFLNKIEMQLANLCKGSSIRSLSDDGAVSSDEEISGGEVEVPEAPQRNEDQDLKARLMNRFGGHISSLKLEFSKKKKKGKLPREARQTLLDWWNAHYKWPYPTEADKVALAESTGLDQKQINNWFINQRKRHWKPSDSMQFGSFENNTGQFYMDD